MSSKVWTQVTARLPAPPEDWAIFHEAFEEHGIGGTVMTDRPPTIAGYAYEPATDLISSLQARLLDLGAEEVVLGTVPEEDWSESWKQFFVPRRVGKRFVIRPTWEQFDTREGDLEIVLDPGQAFGTGDHPTTRMCLELLETSQVRGKEIADIGCGSGILAIGAMLLGARSVLASDIDPVACESARQNSARNAAQFEVHAGKGFEPCPPGADYDIVVSNIISSALIMLAPEARDRVRPGGCWIVSGIIHDNWADVLAAAERAGFRLDLRLQENEWNAARFHR